MIGTKALKEHRRVGRVHSFFSRQTCSLHLNGKSEGKIVILMELHFRPEPPENVIFSLYGLPVTPSAAADGYYFFFFFNKSLRCVQVTQLWCKMLEIKRRKKSLLSDWIWIDFSSLWGILPRQDFSLICVSGEPPSLTCHLHSWHSFSDVQCFKLQENNKHGCRGGRINK